MTVCLAVLTLFVEGADTTWRQVPERMLRGLLFVLSCFLGSYAPVPGQPEHPSLLSVVVLVLALITSIGGVLLTVLSVFASQIGLTIALVRPHRVVVVGDTPHVEAFAEQLRERRLAVITAGTGDRSMIPLESAGRTAQDHRLRRAVRGADAVFVLNSSSVDGAIIAADARAMAGDSHIYQMFDWRLDRLVFREPIRDGRLPRNEVFSPDEMTGTHLGHLIAHLVRMRGGRLKVHLKGTHVALDILRERLDFMRGSLEFRGDVAIVEQLEEADIVVVAVEQHRYVEAVDESVGAERVVITVAPERYFSAIGRDDLRAVSSAAWLAERDDQGRIPWRGRVVLVDEDRIGRDIDEIMLGIRGRWSREFHNAHSDFGSDARAGSPNRWLDRPPHPRLVAMANAAVELMLRDLFECGYELVIRGGEHDVLDVLEVERCARHIHEQYLTQTWLDQRGREHRCADYWIDATGAAVRTTPPPAWGQDTEESRERNRTMVRSVYPALASMFGYRITRTRERQI
ncbi:MAG: hypothetical protein WA971_09180 [Microbacterium sp.]